jgi:hypothetical protein
MMYGRTRKTIFIREAPNLNLNEVLVRPVQSFEDRRFRELMGEHHYLGALPKISETLLYVAVRRDQWVALPGFSAAVLKCTVRDRYIGWDLRHQPSRLKLITNNSRFLILFAMAPPKPLALPHFIFVREKTYRGLTTSLRPASATDRKLLGPFSVQGHGLQGSQLSVRWPNHRTFAEPGQGCSGPVTEDDFRQTDETKRATLLSQPILDPAHRIGDPKMKLSADQMRSLPDFFKTIADPRRAQGRRHRLATVVGHRCRRSAVHDALIIVQRNSNLSFVATRRAQPA